MVKRIPPTKISDIFEIKTIRNTKRYFQYVANDLYQLNSAVVRVFRREFPLEYVPVAEEIVNDDMDFYTHILLKTGLKLEFWIKVGKHINIGEPNKFLFKGTNDYGFTKKPISDKWYVWYLGDNETKKIGYMTDKYRHAEYGGVFPPIEILERINKGKYRGKFPE